MYAVRSPNMRQRSNCFTNRAIRIRGLFASLPSRRLRGRPENTGVQPRPRVAPRLPFSVPYHWGTCMQMRRACWNGTVMVRCHLYDPNIADPPAWTLRSWRDIAKVVEATRGRRNHASEERLFCRCGM
jgi:hypothetical protein